MPLDFKFPQYFNNMHEDEYIEQYRKRAIPLQLNESSRLRKVSFNPELYSNSLLSRTESVIKKNSFLNSYFSQISFDNINLLLPINKPLQTQSSGKYNKLAFFNIFL